MTRINKIWRLFKKHWITVWVIVAAVSLCGIFAYAKFADNKNFTKRVIAADTGNKTLFTSNYLTESHYKNFKTVPKSTSGSTFFEITVYNYDRNNPSTFYPTEINFSLNASLYKSSGTQLYNATNDATALNAILGSDVINIYKGSKTSTPIIVLDKDSVSASESQALAPEEGEKSASTTYYIEMPASVIDKDVYVKLEADPTANHSDIYAIDAYFYVKTNSVDLSTGWNVDLNENTSVTTPAEYDGFNFVITGNGSATKTLSWDNTLLSPNKQQIAQLFGITLSGSESSISISLPSATDNSGQYNIQFYVVDENARKRIDGYTDNENTVHAPMTWGQLEATVTLN